MCDCPASVQQPAGDGLDTAQGQAAALAPYLLDAVTDICWVTPWLGPDADRLLAGGALQMVEAGFDLHGRGLFDMSDDQLQFELRRELEDAVVYRAEQLRRAELKGSE